MARFVEERNAKFICGALLLGCFRDIVIGTRMIRYFVTQTGQRGVATL